MSIATRSHGCRDARARDRSGSFPSSRPSPALSSSWRLRLASPSRERPVVRPDGAVHVRAQRLVRRDHVAEGRRIVARRCPRPGRSPRVCGRRSSVRFAVSHGEYSKSCRRGMPSTMYGARKVGAAKMTASARYSGVAGEARCTSDPRATMRYTSCPRPHVACRRARAGGGRSSRCPRATSAVLFPPLPRREVMDAGPRRRRRAQRAVVVAARVVHVPAQRRRVEALLRAATPPSRGDPVTRTRSTRRSPSES